MEGYITGSQRGDGAVFALDLDGELIFAGTRRGEVKMFDARSSPSKSTREGGGGPPGTGGKETRAEVSERERREGGS